MLLLVAIGCNKELGETKVFSSYLRERYKAEIPKKRHAFIVFPTSGCQGCKEYALDYFSSRHFENVTIICGTKQAQVIGTTNAVLIDKDAEIGSLNLNTQNVAIIWTEDKKVDRIIPLQSDNIDSLLELYF